MEKTFSSSSVSDTRALSARLAAHLNGGEIIFFSGPIGAGKTVFVSGLIKALGLKAKPVSASFSLMKEYKGNGHKIFHIDLFRLEEREMFNFGFEEMLSDEHAIILAEWPDAIKNFISSSRLELEFVLLEGDERTIKISAKGSAAEDLLKKL